MLGADPTVAGNRYRRESRSSSCRLVRQAEQAREPRALDLASWSQGNLVERDDSARGFEQWQAIGHEPSQLALLERTDAMAQDHRHANLLASHSVGSGKGDDIGDRWMVAQCGLDFVRRNLLSTDVDHLFDSAVKGDVPVMVEGPEVARAKPTVMPRALVRGG